MMLRINWDNAAQWMKLNIPVQTKNLYSVWIGCLWCAAIAAWFVPPRTLVSAILLLLPPAVMSVAVRFLCSRSKFVIYRNLLCHGTGDVCTAVLNWAIGLRCFRWTFETEGPQITIGFLSFFSVVAILLWGTRLWRLCRVTGMEEEQLFYQEAAFDYRYNLVIKVGTLGTFILCSVAAWFFLRNSPRHILPLIYFALYLLAQVPDCIVRSQYLLKAYLLHCHPDRDILLEQLEQLEQQERREWQSSVSPDDGAD